MPMVCYIYAESYIKILKIFLYKRKYGKLYEERSKEKADMKSKAHVCVIV